MDPAGPIGLLLAVFALFSFISIFTHREVGRWLFRAELVAMVAILAGYAGFAILADVREEAEERALEDEVDDVVEDLEERLHH